MSEDLDFAKWEACIGKLILACSRVEYEILRLYLKHLPKSDYHKENYLKHFDTAIGIAREKLTGGDKTAELLIQMKQFASWRHIVAHNPIHYKSAIAPDTDGDFVIFDSKNNEKHCTVEQLAEISSTAYSLSVKLAVALRSTV